MKRFKRFIRGSLLFAIAVAGGYVVRNRLSQGKMASYGKAITEKSGGQITPSNVLDPPKGLTGPDASQSAQEKASPVGLEPKRPVETLSKVDKILLCISQSAEKTIPEMRLLTEKELIDATRGNLLETDADTDAALRSLRGRAKVRFSVALGDALRAFVHANEGRLPSTTSELIPFFADNSYFKASHVDSLMLERYTIVHLGLAENVPPEERRSMIVENNSYDEENDQRVQVGLDGGHVGSFRDLDDDVSRALRAFLQANGGQKPRGGQQLLPYFYPPLSPTRQRRFIGSEFNFVH